MNLLFVIEQDLLPTKIVILERSRGWPKSLFTTEARKARNFLVNIRGGTLLFVIEQDVLPTKIVIPSAAEGSAARRKRNDLSSPKGFNPRGGTHIWQQLRVLRASVVNPNAAYPTTVAIQP